MMRKLGGRLVALLIPVINGVLHRVELALSSGSSKPLPHRPVLIVGAPRSGSTLLFQVLTEVLDFGYISNLHCLFSGGPSVVERLVRPLRWRTRSTFASKRGVVSGWSAPSECGGFWYRFFRRKPEYVPGGELDPRQGKKLRAALRALLSAFGRPVLFKNMHCSLRIEPLSAAVPEALFIFIRRDVVDNAHSLLETRRDVYGDYSKWWSMEPPRIAELASLPPEEQVVEQIRGINSLVERQLQERFPGSFIALSYEELIANPRGTVQSVAAFLDAHGAKPAARAGELPESFQAHKSVKIDTELYDRLCAYAAEPSR
jgi:LPS sulfotransferase NodH